jgi:FkbM family methyltransferase
MPIDNITVADSLRVLVMLREHVRDASDDHLAFARFCVENLGWSRSQFLQDLWVAYELKSRRGGYFVEFGGADGIKFSNSYALETELGWSGIVAEPARIWYPALRRNRACAVDDRCVWSASGETLRFNQPAIAVHSTIDSFSASDMHAHTRVEGERYDVTTVSLTDLLDGWQAPRRIDYLSIDTEGSEADILEALDWDRYDIRLITVEHAHTDRRERLFDLLSGKGYRRKFESLSFVDDWYVRAYA